MMDKDMMHVIVNSNISFQGFLYSNSKCPCWFRLIILVDKSFVSNS